MERLQKVLGRAGYGSRREMERWIEAGFIYVNGVKAKVGDSVSVNDKLYVKGKLIKNPLQLTTKTRILLYHKPIGEISSRKDPKHEKTVFDNLPYLKTGRWVQVGRLDLNTSGLLIFTNDGELANHLMHPSSVIEREYAVRVHGRVNPTIIDNLLKGITLEDGFAKFNKIDFKGGEGANSWFNVILQEGRNREVRRLWQSQDIEVSRLIRIRYGALSLPRFLSRGQVYELNPLEVESFFKKINYTFPAS